jgi:hypothetical protein
VLLDWIGAPEFAMHAPALEKTRWYKETLTLLLLLLAQTLRFAVHKKFSTTTTDILVTSSTWVMAFSQTQILKS